MSLSFDEIKDLIGKPGVKLEVRSQFGNVMGVGELVGVLEQPSVLIRHEDGTQHHHAASQTYHLLRKPIAEPGEDGTVVTAHSSGNRVYAFSRRESVHRLTLPEHPAEYCWWWHDNGSWVCWREICEYDDITVLAADPVASGPELPFRLHSGEGAGVVEVISGNPYLTIYDEDDQRVVRLFIKDDGFAYAILRAAREARVAL